VAREKERLGPSADLSFRTQRDPDWFSNKANFLLVFRQNDERNDREPAPNQKVEKFPNGGRFTTTNNRG